MRSRTTLPRKQKGAALIVGLLLLLILTMLAVTGMSTSSTELIMAGNEQYRLNAAQAAETGRETAISVVATVRTDGVPEEVEPTALPDSDDTYESTTTYVGWRSIPGYSDSEFVGLQYEIEITGRSSRNAISEQEQGAFTVQRGPPPPLR